MCEPMGMIYTFDTLKPKEIFQKICSIVGNNQDVTMGRKCWASASIVKRSVLTLRRSSFLSMSKNQRSEIALKQE